MKLHGHLYRSCSWMSPLQARAGWPAPAACAAVWSWMISPFFSSILPCTSLSCSSWRDLDMQQLAFLSSSCNALGKLSLHFLVDELQPTVHCALSFDLVLLEQDRPDELVDSLIFLQLGKLLFQRIRRTSNERKSSCNKPFARQGFPASAPRASVLTVQTPGDLTIAIR